MKFKFLIISFLLSGVIKSQIAPENYWVKFTDKSGTEYSIDQPEMFLSERAISRRQRQGIQITEADLPVSNNYLGILKSHNLTVRYTSKWLNGAVIHCTDTALLDTLSYLGFIDSISFIPDIVQSKAVPNNEFKTQYPQELTSSNQQLTSLNGHILHDLGYTGNGMLIAVLDGGFLKMDEIAAFSPLYLSDRIVATRNYTFLGNSVYEGSSHGTKVMSTIACDPNVYDFPTAPDASFVLLRTEYGPTEHIMEEFNWFAGAEFADSIGADVINSSLGYYSYDYPFYDYSVSDMDGKTTIVSKAAKMATQRGILVVTSAGNEYNDSWKYIIAPADVDSILAVGAIDVDGNIASFSSRGPAADGRIKPDVVAQGVSTQIINSDGNLTTGNGTSYSSPIIAGLVACLLQSVPEATIHDVIEAVKQSSSQYNTPDTIYGHGTPNFLAAFDILGGNPSSIESQLTYLDIRPNPIIENGFIKLTLPWLNQSATAQIKIYNMLGQHVFTQNENVNFGPNYIPFNNLPDKLIGGIYNLVIVVEQRSYSLKFLVN